MNAASKQVSESLSQSLGLRGRVESLLWPQVAQDLDSYGNSGRGCNRGWKLSRFAKEMRSPLRYIIARSAENAVSIE